MTQLTFTGIQGLAYPSGIAFDTSGTMFVTDTGHNRIAKIIGGAITTYASPIAGPFGNVAFNAAGDMFVANSFGGGIVMVS